MEDYWKDKPKELKEVSGNVVAHSSTERASKLIEAYTDEFAKKFAKYINDNAIQIGIGNWYNNGWITTDQLFTEFKKTLQNG